MGVAVGAAPLGPIGGPGQAGTQQQAGGQKGPSCVHGSSSRARAGTAAGGSSAVGGRHSRSLTYGGIYMETKVRSPEIRTGGGSDFGASDFGISSPLRPPPASGLG